jgi:hypothetical protein
MFKNRKQHAKWSQYMTRVTSSAIYSLFVSMWAVLLSHPPLMSGRRVQWVFHGTLLSNCLVSYARASTTYFDFQGCQHRTYSYICPYSRIWCSNNIFKLWGIIIWIYLMLFTITWWEILHCCYEDCETITLKVEKIYRGKVCAALAYCAPAFFSSSNFSGSA